MFTWVVQTMSVLTVEVSLYIWNNDIYSRIEWLLNFRLNHYASYSQNINGIHEFSNGFKTIFNFGEESRHDNSTEYVSFFNMWMNFSFYSYWIVYIQSISELPVDSTRFNSAISSQRYPKQRYSIQALSGTYLSINYVFFTNVWILFADNSSDPSLSAAQPSGICSQCQIPVDSPFPCNSCHRILCTSSIDQGESNLCVSCIIRFSYPL